MELGTTDPVTGDTKTFFFYLLLQYPRKTCHDLITILNIAVKTLEKYHVTMTYVDYLGYPPDRICSPHLITIKDLINYVDFLTLLPWHS